MAWTQEQQDSLEEAYLSGATRWRFGDREQTFVSSAEMEKRIEIGRSLLGLDPMFAVRRVVYAKHSKGLR